MDAGTARIIDANANRIREGLRVVEEYTRFVLNDATLTSALKGLRHDLTTALSSLDNHSIVLSRDSQHDVGRHTGTESEYQRPSTHDIAIASAKRIQEGLRVVEEYAKPASPDVARIFEQLRYRCYEIEQALTIRHAATRRFEDVRLYVLITASLCRHDWCDTAKQTILGGADVIQLREKNLPDAELLDRAKMLANLCREHDRLCFINDRPDIARLAGADGVHVGQDDLTVSDVRRIAGPDLLVGVSTHNPDQLHAAIESNPDYIAVGPMFPSDTKPQDHTPGPELITTAVQHTALPVVPIGGIDATNLDHLVTAGATNICVCSAIIAAQDVQQATADLKAAITNALARHSQPAGT